MLRNKRIEIKYTIIFFMLIGGLFLLATRNIFDGAEQSINSLMVQLARYGAVGMFLIAIPANVILVIQVPYNLPMFTLDSLCTHAMGSGVDRGCDWHWRGNR